jgi:hypothetical protein
MIFASLRAAPAFRPRCGTPSKSKSDWVLTRSTPSSPILPRGRSRRRRQGSSTGATERIVSYYLIDPVIAPPWNVPHRHPTDTKRTANKLCYFLGFVGWRGNRECSRPVVSHPCKTVSPIEDVNDLMTGVPFRGMDAGSWHEKGLVLRPNKNRRPRHICQ